MYNIAVTGSLASGKSFILNYLSNMGYKTFSCDDYVRKLYQDIAIQNLIKNSLEDLDIFNKQNLAKIIYNDAEARDKLEKIIHPKVRIAIKEFEEENKKENFLFTEVPLLFESGFDKYFSFSICVFCSEKTRIKRANSRGGAIDPNILEKIKQIQLGQEEKKKRADFLIDSEEEDKKIKANLVAIINAIK
ncbi:MAG: dephospho-CoA kinase [Rickettsiaceae bacterium]|nr:dephospho-CoA kinase [Rickettsiaceae bacterium]MDP4832622.1 dephospho-CoA kinase [Rickettsiaceae bacterium]MDP5021244.1 dephospho-CoA kinase [Rickettsiaceae bacterium]MDP5083181.1 dephospho-CoA kinase [Rickettsiaceae bacterium]